MRFLVVIASLATLCYSADHNVFKDCSRIEFCDKNRGLKLDERHQFAAMISQLRHHNDTAIIVLRNEAKKILNLEITLLEQDRVRVKIVERNHKRYELNDILDKEPKTLPYKHITDKYTLTLTPSDTKYKHKVIVTQGPPFKVEFYQDDTLLQNVLSGQRLAMEKTNTSQVFTFSIEFPGASKLYGLHHHATNLELVETKNIDPFRLRNSDNANYEVPSPMALYGAVPAVYGHSANSTSGIFLHNAAEQWIDVSYEPVPSVYFMVESGTLDLFVLLGPSIKNVVRQFTDLTGVAHLPQLWTLGYHQCRWSYYTQEDVKSVVANMDQNKFPLDAIWLDIDYSDGKRYFTWNPENFSDPADLQRNLSSTNRKLVTILDPHIMKDDDYPVYAQAKGKYFVKWENGSDFEGVCWPGLSSYIDFLNPEARDYYASWYDYSKFNNSEGVAGVWNDMNEPSVFDDSLEKTLPFEVLHHGNVRHRDIHNIYGFLQTKATHQGLMQRDKGKKRPFILTRSHFAGSQRYAIMWTGDNTADWPYLQVSYSECLLSNLMGLVFCGADVGGFFGDPDKELLQRWYQAGVWLPFYRGHASDSSPRREPYLYTNDIQDVIRTAINLRYSHIPVWYTLFFEHVISGDPVIRPLFYDYPDNFNHNDHILLGSNILARPILEKNVTSIDVYFPGDESVYWYKIYDDVKKFYIGGEIEKFEVNITTSPYFYKGGSIIFRKDIIRRNTHETLNDPYTLYINLDGDGSASGTLYIDDYTSFDYQKNKYLYAQFNYSLNDHKIRISILGGNLSPRLLNIKEAIISKPRTAVSGNTYTLTTIETSAKNKRLVELNIGEMLMNTREVTIDL